MTEDQRMQYQGLITFLNRDVEIRWGGARFFALIHLAGLSALTTGFFESNLHIAGVACVGVVLSLFWILGTVRMEFWIRHWVWMLSQIEQIGQAELKPFTASMPNLDKGHSTTLLLILLAAVTAILWIITAYSVIVQ